jgi:hypothetical protein
MLLLVAAVCSCALAVCGAVIPDAAWAQFKSSVTGSVVLPSDAAYAAATVQWNNRFTTTPAGIVYVASTADVATTLQFAQTYVFTCTMPHQSLTACCHVPLVASWAAAHGTDTPGWLRSAHFVSVVAELAARSDRAVARGTRTHPHAALAYAVRAWACGRSEARRPTPPSHFAHLPSGDLLC